VSPAGASSRSRAEPLLDDEAMGALERLMGRAELAALVSRGMESYQGYCDRMVAPGVNAVDIYREAHKLKGSSGTLGLCAICALAGQIETLCTDSRPVTDLVARLRRTLAATQAELVLHGLLPVPG
jgi:HPt (histidine-containing phosphotransfer) domain-containing protein